MVRILIATAAFFLVELLDPFGLSTQSDRLSADLTQRLAGYCYDGSARKEIVVLLIRGKELAAIRSGWPMRLDVYAEYLEWLADFGPAAVFLDVGLIKAGSIAALDCDPCDMVRADLPGDTQDPPTCGGEPAPYWLDTFGLLVHELKDRYRPIVSEVAANQEGGLRSRGAGDGPARTHARSIVDLAPDDTRIPLLLASGNPLHNRWMSDLRMRWEPGGYFGDELPGEKQVTSATLLPDCLSDLGTAVPVRWEPSRGYPPGFPLSIGTGRDSSGTPRFEPSAAYLLYRAYCAGRSRNGGPVPPGCQIDADSVLLPDDLRAFDPPAIVVHWGKLSNPDSPLDRLWQCAATATDTSFAAYLMRDAARGLGDEEHLELCPYHPTIPFVAGEAWPSEVITTTEAAPSGAAKTRSFPLPTPSEALSGKIVIIGTDIPGYLDRIESPVHGIYPGAFLHAMIVDNLLVKGDDYFKPAETPVAWLPLSLNDYIEVLGVFLAGTFAWWFTRRFEVPDPAQPPSLANPSTTQRLGSRMYALASDMKRFVTADFPNWCDQSLPINATNGRRCHNARVAEVSLKIQLATLILLFLGYFFASYLSDRDPLLDFILPTLFATFVNAQNLPQALLGIGSDLFQSLRHLSRRTLLRLASAVAVTAVLLLWFAQGCRGLGWMDLGILGLTILIVSFSLSDAVLLVLRERCSPFVRRHGELSDGNK